MTIVYHVREFINITTMTILDYLLRIQYSYNKTSSLENTPQHVKLC